MFELIVYIINELQIWIWYYINLITYLQNIFSSLFHYFLERIHKGYNIINS